MKARNLFLAIVVAVTTIRLLFVGGPSQGAPKEFAAE